MREYQTVEEVWDGWMKGNWKEKPKQTDSLV